MIVDSASIAPTNATAEKSKKKCYRCNRNEIVRHCYGHGPWKALETWRFKSLHGRYKELIYGIMKGEWRGSLRKYSKFVTTVGKLNQQRYTFAPSSNRSRIPAMAPQESRLFNLVHLNYANVYCKCLSGVKWRHCLSTRAVLNRDPYKDPNGIPIRIHRAAGSIYSQGGI